MLSKIALRYTDLDELNDLVCQRQVLDALKPICAWLFRNSAWTNIERVFIDGDRLHENRPDGRTLVVELEFQVAPSLSLVKEPLKEPENLKQSVSAFYQRLAMALRPVLGDGYCLEVASPQWGARSLGYPYLSPEVVV